MLVSSWIANFCRRRKVVVYLGDISGAFDKVFKDYLLAKLQTAGVADLFLDFLNAYLEPRVGMVAVEGVLSDAFALADTVFQGTVLGPVLWNTFFGDVAAAATSHEAQEATFADDLNAFKSYPLHESNDDAIEDMQRTRASIHNWGKRNRVTFETTKEHIIVLHPLHGQGELVRLLGCVLDCRLNM